MVSRRSLLAALAATPLAPRAVLATADRFASAWSEGSHSAIRLIIGDGGQAAIEFRLAPGFKTYWRDPGDSGVPPTFDWSGSANAGRVEVLWPAPHRFDDGATFYIGYHSPLIMPLRITPADATQPVTLRLKIDYAVCETMCIPAQGAAETPLIFASDSPHAARIAAALKKTPPRLAPGAAHPYGGFSLSDISLIDGPKPALAATATLPRAASSDLFIEGPKGSFFGKPTVEYPLDQPADTNFVRRRFIAPIEERAKKLARWPLLLTLAVDDRAIEVAAEIDAPR